MKRYLLLILSATGLPAALLAQASHLDIRRPSRVVAGYSGPVKEVVNEDNYNMSDLKYKELILYDKEGNLLSRTKYDSKGERTYLATNTFSEAGCMVRQRVENVSEKTTNDYEIVLNIPARKIAFCCKITGEVEVIEYNEDKYKMSATIKKKGGRTLPLSRYQRHPDNRKKSYTRYTDKGRPEYTTAFDLDDQNRVSRSIVTYKAEKKRNLLLYEYLSTDEHGNWTQRLHQSLDMLDNKKKLYEKFSTRKIEYYADGEDPEAAEEPTEVEDKTTTEKPNTKTEAETDTEEGPDE